MAEKEKSPNRYTSVIDLTSRAQKKASTEKAMARMSEQEDTFPEAKLDDLPDSIQQAMQAAGWKDLMPVQRKAIPYLLGGNDLIVQSRTGSGKTGAFILPLFELLDPSRKEPQALVLCPTRELARQIHEEFERLKEGRKRKSALHSAAIYGGVRYGPQNRALKEGAQLIIGTPGRILDHLERRTFTLDALRFLIFDEADEMLSMGFYPDMRRIKRYLPEKRHSYMFSATMPPKVRSLAREFLDDPGFLTLSTGNVSAQEIAHYYHVVDPMQKDRVLARVIEMENPDSAIIFANTRRDVEYLATFLRNYGYDADEISGDLSQKAREEVMDRVRQGTLKFLVATDVAARGIDISDLSHVFMYDVPQDPEYYIHRSGRTARAGKTGIAIVLVAPAEEQAIKRIAAQYGVEIEKRPVPEPEEVAARVSERMTVVLEDLMREKSNLERERLARFVPLVEELVKEEPELLAMLVDDLYQRRLHYASSSPEETRPTEQTKRKKSSRRGTGQRSGRSKSGRKKNS